MGKPKTPKIPGRLRAVFAANLERALERHYPGASDKAAALEEDLRKRGSTLTDSSIRRYLRAETGPSLDNIEAIADALGVTVHDLLGPVTRAHALKIVAPEPPPAAILRVASPRPTYRVRKKKP
ncbi:MAG TPA: helix-turn-helix domain-containing protein [Burkholderiales bacterium]|nr:helix-turn-helix domain-containing protein [Burkholderiales bacterium]